MAQSTMGRSHRFYINPALRDQEWNRAKQAPWLLVVIVLACVIIGFFAGVYADTPYSLIGWLAGSFAIVVYLALGRFRRHRARRQLRRVHSQPVS